MKKIPILLVEDNEGDIVLFKEALQEGGFTCKLEVVRDGEEALRFLNREGDYAQEPDPALIVLDINLPKMNGMELLRELKRDPVHQRIPVVVFTTSSSRQDILEAYANFVNSYIIKPGNLQAFIKVVQFIIDYWINIVRLPNTV
jgi:chemotaxis family two-component system response regulator Rcp1